MADAARDSSVADAIGMYLESVATHDLLTAEDEVELAANEEFYWPCRLVLCVCVCVCVCE